MLGLTRYLLAKSSLILRATGLPPVNDKSADQTVGPPSIASSTFKVDCASELLINFCRCEVVNESRETGNKYPQGDNASASSTLMVWPLRILESVLQIPMTVFFSVFWIQAIGLYDLWSKNRNVSCSH